MYHNFMNLQIDLYLRTFANKAKKIKGLSDINSAIKIKGLFVNFPLTSVF